MLFLQIRFVFRTWQFVLMFFLRGFCLVVYHPSFVEEFLKHFWFVQAFVSVTLYLPLGPPLQKSAVKEFDILLAHIVIHCYS